MFTLAKQPEINFKALDEAHSFLSEQKQEPKIAKFDRLSLKDDDLAFDGEVYSITKLAKRQLLAELVPGGSHFLNSEEVPEDLKQIVVSRMLDEKKENQKMFWFEQNPGEDKPYIKAMVSEKYAFYSNKQLVEHLLNTAPNAKAIRPSLYKGIFSTSLIDPKAPLSAFRDKKGNDRELFMGSTYLNGEGCQRALEMKPFSFDAFCNNGAIFGKKFIEELSARKKHVGSAANIFAWAGLKFQTIAAEHLTFVKEAYINMMNTAVTGLYFKYIQEQALEVINNKTFETNFRFQEDATRFELYNSINEFAHIGNNSQKTRLGLEQLAGQMVEESFLV